MHQRWFGIHRRPLAVAALVVTLILVAGCAPLPSRTTGQAQAPNREPSAAVVVVRVIPGAHDVVAAPGGGRLALVSSNDTGDDRVFVLASWDATPAVALGRSLGGPIWIHASLAGVYLSDWKSGRFATWDGSVEATLPAYAEGTIIPSPSGTRLLVDFGRRPSNTARDSMPLLVDRSRRNLVRTWSRSINFSGGATWLSDAQFLYDGDPDGLPAEIYLATLDSADRVTVAKTGIVGLCPASSPDGSTWAYYDAQRMLILYDPIAKREILRWPTSTEPGLDLPSSPPAWADDTHVLASAWDARGANLSVLDVSAPLGRYRASP